LAKVLVKLIDAALPLRESPFLEEWFTEIINLHGSTKLQNSIRNSFGSKNSMHRHVLL